MLVCQGLPDSALHGVQLLGLQSADVFDPLGQLLAALLKNAVQIVVHDVNGNFESGGNLRRSLTRQTHLHNPRAALGN